MVTTMGYNDFKNGVALCDNCKKSWFEYFAIHNAWAGCHWKKAFNAWRNGREVVQFT